MAYATVIVPCYPPSAVILWVLAAILFATDTFIVWSTSIAVWIGWYDSISISRLPATAAAERKCKRKLRPQWPT